MNSMNSMNSKTESKTESTESKSYFLNRVVNTAAWGDMSDSDSDDDTVKTVPNAVKTVPNAVKTVPKTVPNAVPNAVPKTWAKLPIQQVQQVQVQQVQVQQVQVQQVQEPARCTLMVKNLPRDTTPEKLANELRSIFKAYGPIKDVYIPINRDGKYIGTIKGFAKVQFHKSESASNAYHAVITIRKNTLSIEYANQDR
jgi:hypothetical protein